MKFLVSRWTLIFVAAVVIASCTDNEPIDKQYLESKEYRRFEKDQQEEYAARRKNYQSLRDFLAEFLECKIDEEWEYPFQIDDHRLGENKSGCGKAAQEEKINYQGQYIAYTTYGDITVRWILIQKESAYEDKQLLAATYSQDTLVDFRMVGAFKKNLKKDISTSIQVTQKGNYLYLKSSINRGIKYPLKYDNVIQSTFRINPKGRIEETTDKAMAVQPLPKYLKDGSFRSK